MTSIHPTAARGFDVGARLYARARPGYPAAAIDRLIETLAVPPSATVIDLGAGTGKLTGALAERGLRPVGVEPVEGMRSWFARALPAVPLVAARAEAIPFANASAGAVTVAQAFHWFDLERALPEIHRVLRPGGRLALAWNARDERVDWVRRLAEIVDEHEGDVAIVRHRQGRWRESMAASPLFRLVLQEEFEHAQTFTAAGLEERVGSISFIAALPDRERADVLARVRTLAATHPALRGRDTFEHPYVTEIDVYERVG